MSTRRDFLRAACSLGLGRLLPPVAMTAVFPAASGGQSGSDPGFDIPHPTLEHIPRLGKSWSPLNHLLARFYSQQDRFSSERQMRSLRAPLERLRAALLDGGEGLEQCLSPGFRGVAVLPLHETMLRSDECFEVRRAEWKIDEGHPDSPAIGPAEFSTAVRQLLANHRPLALAELACVGIAELPNSDRAASEVRNLVARIRFDLAGTRLAESGNGVKARWQSSGEWEIEFEAVRGSDSVHDDPPTPNRGGHGASTAVNAPSPPEPGWRIVGWRPLEMTTVCGPATAFTEVTAAAFGRGLTYESHLLRDTNYWRAVLDEASGIDIFGNCGVSVGDADGDGQDEIYLCQPQGLPNRLYRQVSSGVFEDIAARADVDLLDATSMALFADVLNRGYQDLIVITQSSPLLFLNDGHGQFTLKPSAFPEAPQRASLTGAAIADYDNDGRLDLYVCSYGYFQGSGPEAIPTPYYDARNGPPNHLYHNRGDGTFEDVTAASGLDRGNDRFSFACAWHDVDDDGWPDLVVVNDFGRNNLYRNRRDGTFEEVTDGVPGYGSGMSAAFTDFDGDGRAELYVGNMWSTAGERVTADPEFQQQFHDVQVPVRQFAMGNALYKTNSPESSARVPALTEIPSAGGAARGRWAWCSDSFDLENDGKPDLYVVNGFLSAPEVTPGSAGPEAMRGGANRCPQMPDAQAPPARFPDAADGRDPVDAFLWQEVVASSPHSAATSADYRAAWTAIFELAHRGHSWNGNERNVFFLNLGGGTFADASAAVGLDFTDDGRSFAVLDYDGDGDSDLIIHSRTGPQLRLLRNDLQHSNHSLGIRLRATTGNRDAIGARVEVQTPGGTQVRWLGCGSGFLAQHSKEMVFGLGPHSAAAVVRVRWPGGAVTEYSNLEAGYRYYLVEGDRSPCRERLAARSGPSNSGTPSGDAVGLGDLRSELHSRERAAYAAPVRFSAAMVEPLLLPPSAWLASASALFDKSTRRVLLWLSDPAGHNDSGLQPFMEAQKEIPAQLVLWGESNLSPEVSKSLARPPWRANPRFRLFWSTVMEHLFDYRREIVLPTGLLLEASPDGAGTLRTGRSPDPSEARNSGGARLMKLVKLYWGGAEPAEILRDARAGAANGLAALPFPGRAVLCSFRRGARELGAALATAGLAIEAEVYLAEAAQNNADADALYNLALVRREIGKLRAAFRDVRAALNARPNFPEADNLLGVLLMQSGQLRPAQEQFEKATREAPDSVEAWNNLGYVFLQQGDLNAAETPLERAQALAPEFPETLNNLGILAARRSDPEKAGALFQRVLALEPENEQAANNLGVLYARQGKTGQAVAILKGVLERNPEAGSALLNLARLELSLKQNEEARDLLKSWLARHPDDSAASALYRNAIQ